MAHAPAPSEAPSVPCACPLCSALAMPPCLCTPSPTWASVLRVALYCLQASRPGSFFKLTEINAWVAAHWDRMGLVYKGLENWKKSCQDALSHNSKFFVSAREGEPAFRGSGLWRLRIRASPWEDLDDFHSPSTGLLLPPPASLEPRRKERNSEDEPPVAKRAREVRELALEAAELSAAIRGAAVEISRCISRVSAAAACAQAVAASAILEADGGGLEMQEEQSAAAADALVMLSATQR
eukprot:m51a1_g3185 hypothetical protein (239) ;mRNA; f:423361-424278